MSMHEPGCVAVSPSDRMPHLTAMRAGIDRLRVTCGWSAGDDDARERARELARGVAREALGGASCDEAPYHQQGCSGSRFAGCAWGVGDAWLMLDAHGSCAEALARTRPAFDRIPRLDVHVTLMLADDVAPALVHMALLSFQGKRRAGKMPGWRYINSDTVDALSIGSRASRRVVRVVDWGRHAASGSGYALRIALHLRDAAAAYRTLDAADFAPDAVARLIQQHAADYGLDWLIPLPARH